MNLLTPRIYYFFLSWTNETSSILVDSEKKRPKEQTTIYKTLHKKHKIEQHEPHEKSGLS
jgi:hypothetical protein